jgi:hypothetical protein
MQGAAFQPHAGQISPDSVQYFLEGYKDVNFRYTTAAFSLSPESGALPCGADLPRDWALYAVSVRRLIALLSGLAAPFGRFRLRLTFRFASPSDEPSRERPCRRLMFMSMSYDIDRFHT